MKKIYLSVIFSLLLSTVLLHAQQVYQRCSAMEYLSEQLRDNPQLAQRMQEIEEHTKQYEQSGNTGSRSIITIPVVVHVLYNTSTQNISDAHIQAQIAQLNADFAKLNSDAGNVPSAFAGLAANTEIQFCLAQRDPSGNPTTGIVRKSTTVTSFSSNNAMKYSSQGGDNAWPAGSYLNIWSCNLGSGLLGYAQFPGGNAATDGVVILYSAIGSLTTPGTAAPYHYGRTATHEVGHWLNLYHIWGDDGNGCTGSDAVGDTPNQADENYGCPAFPTVSCSNGPNGDMFMNYMDYTNDACMYMFTNGQSTRMNALFSTGGARYGLLSSQGCQPIVVTGCAVPSGLTTSNITTSSVTISWGAVSGAVSYTVQWRVAGTSTWSSGSTTSVTNTLSGLSAGTAYEWRVSTVCASSSSEYSSVATFTTTTVSSCSDIYESNNTSGTAKVPALNTNLSGLITPSTDVDWFRFTTTSPNTRVRVDLSTLPADYDIALYRGSTRSRVGLSQNSGTTSEAIVYNTTKAYTYYLKVYGYNGAMSASSCYTLRISTSSSSFRTADGEVMADELDLVAEPVMKVFPNPAKDKLTVEFMSNGDSKVNLTIYNLYGQRIYTESVITTEGLNTQTINTSLLSKGVYVFEVDENGEMQRHQFVISD